MCYKKPGPRCSYHAKKKLREAKANLKEKGFGSGMEVYTQAKEEVEAAQLDYDSTPAGMAEMKLKIERGEDHNGAIKARLDYCQANRKAMLAKVKAEEQGDIYNHGKISPKDMNMSEFETGTRIKLVNREDKEEIINNYNLHSDKLAVSLTEQEHADLYWYTSDGHGIINAYIHKQNGTYDENMGSTGSYKKKKIVQAIESMDSVFAKNKLKKPMVTYRGLSYRNFPEQKEDGSSDRADFTQYAKDRYPEGSIHTFPNYQSTSIDPNKAVSFATSEVILEIKAKSSIALGSVSSWESEREMLINRNTKFRVVSVDEQAPYDARGGFGKRTERHFTVIQLEEID